METKMSKYRWVVVALLFFATTINYIDRQVIGLLKDYLAHDFGWSESDYSNIVMAFTAAYAAGLLFVGRSIDFTGTKLGYSICIVVWSIAAMGHAMVRTTFGFSVARSVLGLGESGNFPAGIRAVAEWFPKKERAFATGIFNSGTNIAAVIGPFAVMWIYREFGWRQAFLWTGVLGFVLLFFWLIYYNLPKKIKKVNQAELSYIQSDGEELENHETPKTSWGQLLGYRQTWAFLLGKFFTDPIWWFYLFWVPTYFNSVYHLDLKQSWIYVSVIYMVAGIGSVGGGWLPGYLIRKGWTIRRARMNSMLIYAFMVLPVILIQYTTNVWTAVALISLATAAHQAWSANIFTTVSDFFPTRSVSSVVGIGGMMGSVGGILFPFFIGIILDHFKLIGKISSGYNIIFVICGFAYLVAWTIMTLLFKGSDKSKIPMLA
ncbi:MAG: MFS transporter [Bacteroidetes bacterium]|nr:MAG: MFS transporter [Bacteroidota bacterium]